MAFDFYFAGSQHSTSEEVMCELQANVLKSYLNDKKAILQWFENKKLGWKGKLLIDSGAFTAHRKDVELNCDEYIEWLNNNEQFIDYYIQLDHIPGKFGVSRTLEQVLEGPRKTYENYVYMVSKLKNPHKLLPVFHMGEDFSNLTRLVNYKIDGQYIKYICISGMKDRTAKERKNWYKKCFEIIANSNNPTIKTHCLGSATMSDVQQFGFTSMDATTWIMTSANGNILSDYGNICVSANNLTKDNQVTATQQDQTTLLEICDKYKVTIQELQTDYRKRSEVNIRWLYEHSRKVSYSPTTIKRRRLF